MSTTQTEHAVSNAGRLADLVASLETATERGDLGAIIEGVTKLRQLVRNAEEPPARSIADQAVGELMRAFQRPAGPRADWRVWSPLLGLTAAAVSGGHLAVATQQAGRAARVRPIRDVYADAGVVHLLAAS